MSKNDTDMSDTVVGHIGEDSNGLDQVGYGFPSSMFGPTGPVKRTTTIRLPRTVGNDSDPIEINVESTMHPSQDTHTEVTVDGDVSDSDLAHIVEIVASLFRA